MNEFAKKIAPWLGLIAFLFSLITYALGFFVIKEVYLQNQRTQDQHLFDLEDRVRKLEQAHK